jgi:hypothetical protein
MAHPKFFSGFGGIVLLLAACQREPIELHTTVSTFRESGLDVAWDHSGSNRIAYSTKGADGYYDIHFALPDGSQDTCLTCDHPALPNRHIALPYWHPNGNWLLTVVEKADHPGSSTDALPGFGAYSDVWILSSDGQIAHKLIDIPNDYSHGIIAPRFSPDGNSLVWTDRKSQPNPLWPPETFGFWTIKLADFHWGTDSIPYIDNIRTFEPEGSAFYECYGWNPDGTKLILCSSANKLSALDQHIYLLNPVSGAMTALTDKDYNEHAFFTPDGEKIVWMSNTQSTFGGTDWWMMNVDGTDKHRLTYFNEPDNVQSMDAAVWAGLGSFSPDGDRFIGGMQLSLTTQEGKIVMVELE